ncbi:enoyl-CoA hydratase/carnithine racemase [Trametes polyzona]|nr:enoyl-CoA hydratase/carnithine racemase [Trametes polyzona]
MAQGTSYQSPSHSDEIKVSFPREHILLLTFNRPKSLNAVTPTMTEDVKRVMDWFDNEPSLWVAIVTGEGRAFCAGADLVAWNKLKASGPSKESDQDRIINHPDGFASLSRRYSTSKPIIAAVNGGAYGGGVEVLLNCDLVIASEDAKFALPEVKRGVVAVQGGMPRLSRTAGHQRASEMLLLGRTITAQDAATRFGFVNKVVPKSEVLPTAFAWAAEIMENSPDAVQSTKRALLIATRSGSVEEAVIAHVKTKESDRAFTSENIKEGLRAFTEKRKPSWRNPAKL